MKVALLGGTGLVGSHIAYALLNAGHTLRISARTQESIDHLHNVLALYGYTSRDHFECVDTDVAVYTEVCELLEGCDAVVHAAAKVTLSQTGRRAEQNLVLYNTQLATTVTEAAIEMGVGAFIHIGSIAALGKSIKAEPIDEDTYLDNPMRATAYARSKYESERIVMRLAPQDVRLIIINPGVVLAPQIRPGSSADFSDLLLRGVTFCPSGSLAWVDARDVADCVVAALQSESFSGRLTAVSGVTKYIDLFNAAADITGTKRRPKRIIDKRWASWARPFLATARAMGVVPAELTWSTIKSSLRTDDYIRQVATYQLGICWRSLQETIRFITSRPANQDAAIQAPTEQE